MASGNRCCPIARCAATSRSLKRDTRCCALSVAGAQSSASANVFVEPKRTSAPARTLAHTAMKRNTPIELISVFAHRVALKWLLPQLIGGAAHQNIIAWFRLPQMTPADPGINTILRFQRHGLPGLPAIRGK